MHSTDATRNIKKPDTGKRINEHKGGYVITSREWVLDYPIIAVYFVSNINCADSYADKPSTADVHTKVILAHIVHKENTQCAILKVLSGGKSFVDSISRHALANTDQTNQGVRGEPTNTPETLSMDPANRIRRKLPATRR